ncbi:MAG: ABC transporter permease [Candidatus Lokiarchaeota archaeon]|nr:ABC transporter permease [Candidatus Lokiarchaeota archaeon]
MILMDFLFYFKKDFSINKAENLFNLSLLLVANLAIMSVISIFVILQLNPFFFSFTNWYFGFIHDYLTTLFILSIIFVGIIYFLNIQNWLIKKRKDIGIIKALGGLNYIRTIFLTEIFSFTIISFILCITIFPIIFYSIYYMLLFSGFTVTLRYPIIEILLVAGFLFGISWLFGGLLINFYYKKPISNLLSKEKMIISEQKEKNKSRRRFNWLKFEYKFAKRSNDRQSSKNNRLYVSLLLCFFSISLVIFSTITYNNSSNTYLSRSIDGDDYILGERNFIGNYTELLNLRSTTPLNQYEGLKNINIINQTLIETLEATIGVQIDKRLVVSLTVTEIPYTIGYARIGNYNTFEMLAIGINRSSSFYNAYVNVPLSQLQNGIILGDFVYFNVIFSPDYEKIEINDAIHGKSPIYNIIGYTIDPLAQGRNCLMDQETLCNYLSLSIDSSNLIFLKFTNKSQISVVQNLINTQYSNLSLINLQMVSSENLNYANIIWFPFFIFPFLLVFFSSLCFCIFFYQKYKDDKTDYVILRALGTQKTSFLKILLFENFLFTIPASFSGIALGFIISIILYFQVMLNPLLIFLYFLILTLTIIASTNFVIIPVYILTRKKLGI